MKTEVTRSEFIAHLSNLFDGETTLAATYTYPAEVALDHGGGPVVARETFECFMSGGRNNAGTIIKITRPGTLATLFQMDKAETLVSLERFLAEQPDARFFLNDERRLSLWSFAP